MNNKKIASLAAIALVIGIAFLSWNKIESGIYNEGYSAAVKEYQRILIEEQNKSTDELNRRLQRLRLELQEQYQREIDRISSDKVIDERVVTVTEYIEKEVYVKEECDTVPVSFNRMLNDTIKSINSGK